jgi:hypothetical protein
VAVAGVHGVGSLIALTIVARIRSRRGVWREATMVGDGGAVGCVEITSWLRGPRQLLRACELETPEGPVPVARARARARRRRAPAARRRWCPGSSGLDIERVEGTTSASTQMALAAWQPCVAYLVMVVIVAVPALYAAWKFQL